MARPFSYPEVQQLEVGQHALIEAPASEVRRKVTLYGSRCNKHFMVSGSAETGKTYVQRIQPATEVPLAS